MPEFTFHNAPELAACHNDRVVLRRHAGIPTAARDWLQGVSHVRPRAATLQNAFLFSEVFERGALDLATWQLPWKVEDYWLAIEYPPAYEPARDNLLLNVQHAAAFEAAGAQSGLLLDDWTELIPNERETAALAVHFDRPNSEPPQALLLAVAPTLDETWHWDDLIVTLRETMDLARVRAVEPAHIDASLYVQLLPATMAVVAQDVATMSLNYERASGLNLEIGE
jgi:hypothetical protein